MDEDTRLKAREYLIRSKAYRFVALIFAVLGVIIFAYLYYHHFDGDLMQAMTSVWVVPIILLPFLPAFILSLMASRADKKLAKLMGGENSK